MFNHIEGEQMIRVVENELQVLTIRRATMLS